MKNRIIYTLLFFLTLNFTQKVCAQENLNRHWDAGKIKGVRFLPYPYYQGPTFLNDTWMLGKIEFAGGEIVDSLYIKYSSFKDELVYYNKAISTQIVIDKISLNGFSFIDKDGENRIFRKYYYDDFKKSDRYFEVLSKGETDLLAYRNVELTTTMAYMDESKILKNLDYEKNYTYYFYSPERGYISVRMNMTAFLAKFDKTLKKPIKKLLRKSRIRVSDEASFIDAWKVVEKEGYKVVFENPDTSHL